MCSDVRNMGCPRNASNPRVAACNFSHSIYSQSRRCFSARRGSALDLDLACDLPAPWAQAEWSRCVRGRAAGSRERREGPWMARLAGPWSNDGAREVAAQRRPKVGARLFGFFWGDCQKKLARKARNKMPSQRGKEEQHPYKICSMYFCFSASTSRLVSRLTRESLLSVATKVTKSACPNLGLALRSRSPRTVVVPGAGETGHPWPFTPFAAPCRSTPSTTTPLGLR
jgi:hypothetical protein